MPRLRTPTQETSASIGGIDGRRATAGDFGVTGLEGIVDKVEASFAVIKDNAERANVSDIQAKLAQAQAEWTVNLAERGQSMQPGDTTFLPKFDEDLQKYLGETEQNLVSTEAGRRVFQKEASQMRAHFFAQAGVMQAKAVGAKAVQDYSTLVDAYTRTVTIDPTQTDMLLQRAEAAINDPSGIYAKVPEPQRKELLRKAKEDITYGSVRGLIGMDAALALKKLKDGQYKDIDPQKLDDLIDRATARVEHNEGKKQREEALAKAARLEKAKEVEGEFNRRILDPKGRGGMPTDKEIADNPHLTADDVKQVYAFKRARIRESLEGEGQNPTEVRKLQLAIWADDSAPNKVYSSKPIYDAFAAGKISSKEAEKLLDLQSKAKGDAVQPLNAAIKGTVARTAKNMTASMGYLMQPDQLNEAQNQMTYDVLNAVEERRKENKNPRDLLTPGHKDYFFTPERMSTYFRTPQQSLAEGAAAAKAGARTSSGQITQAPVAITTQAEWAKLPKGTIYQRPGMPPQVKQ